MLSRIDALSKSRALMVTLVAVITLALAGTTVGYATMTKDVSLSVDGEARTVSALGGTVGDVLESEGIDLGPHDEVAPGLDEEVVDGSEIAVRHARPLALTVDGDEQTHWVLATEVGSALTEIGLRFAGADLSASRSAPIGLDGLDLEVVTAKTIKIAVAGKKARAKTVAAITVADVLDELGVKYDDDDIVRPRLTREIAEGDKIRVTRIRIVRKQVTGESIAFETIERDDATMYEGESTTVQAGVPGLRDVTYELTFRNGKLVARKVVTSDVTRQAVDAIVKVGTKSQPAPDFSGGSTVWDRLAQCESGGNWSINTGNGYYGGLQFSLSTWRAYGGTGYPHQHSRETQIAIATKLRDASGGYGAWPACSSKLGLPR